MKSTLMNMDLLGEPINTHFHTLQMQIYSACRTNTCMSQLGTALPEGLQALPAETCSGMLRMLPQDSDPAYGYIPAGLISKSTASHNFH